MSAGVVVTRSRTRPVTVYLRARGADGGEVVGEVALALVLGVDPALPTSGVWVITHGLGSPAGGTHTEVSFVDGSTADLPEHLVDDLVRQVARELYGTRWSFHYRPDEVERAVLAHGSLVRERVEVSAVRVYA